MGMFGPKPCTYWVTSKSDPRFNQYWPSDGLVCGGMPEWLDAWIKKKAEDLGIEIPNDLDWGMMKD